MQAHAPKPAPGERHKHVTLTDARGLAGPIDRMMMNRGLMERVR